jgi:hypothetical protein
MYEYVYLDMYMCVCCWCACACALNHQSFSHSAFPEFKTHAVLTTFSLVRFRIGFKKLMMPVPPVPLPPAASPNERSPFAFAVAIAAFRCSATMYTLTISMWRLRNVVNEWTVSLYV